MKLCKTLGITLGLALTAAITHATEETGVKPEIALTKLKEGNARYVSAKMTHPQQSSKTRTEVAKGQHPFAIIVGCSDSRVPPEVIFDQGVGDLFVIRSAGNIVDNVGLGSIEYAVEHLGVKLIVVLGHERCGAVDATVKGGTAPGHIANLVEAIKPAVEQAKAKQGDPLENSVQSNVSLCVTSLKNSKPILEEFVKSGKVVVVGGRYDLDDGKVEFYP